MGTERELPFMQYGQTRVEAADAKGVCADLVSCIQNEVLIPFLNNSLRDDRFAAMFGLPGANLDEVIAENWARKIDYRLRDPSDLAKVAQFRQVTTGSAFRAKRDYLDYLKETLLSYAERNDKVAAALIERHNLRQNRNLGVADLACTLGYPTYAPGEADPLRLLAQLPFPIYITTSFYDFLERELEKEGKDYRSEVCTWSGKAVVSDRTYFPDPKYEPSAERPLVFHLFGLERFPETLVLSVDDYLNFLVRIFLREAEAKTSSSSGAPPAIPTYLWEKISELHLLLLGYRIRAWDFQIVFRGIISAKPTSARSDAGMVVHPSDAEMVIQLEPGKEPKTIDDEKIHDYAKQYHDYLKHYFDQEVKFRVELDKPDEFVAKLYQAYQNQT